MNNTMKLRMAYDIVNNASFCHAETITYENK